MSALPSRLILLLSLALTLTGCSMAQAPSFYMFGSYFPSWLIGTVVGIVGTVIVRGLLIRLGIDDALPARLLVYCCLALIIAMTFSYLFSPQ